MQLRRLGWAGIELEHGGATLVIDALGSPGPFEPFFRADADPLLAPSQPPVAALVTHLHRDHADIAAIVAASRPGTPLLRPSPAPPSSAAQRFLTGEAEAALTGAPLEAIVVAPGQTHEFGPFHVTATFASDGLGTPQVGWVVSASGATLLHAGDTLWHGAWWSIAEAHGPIDVACLPANGPRVDFPVLQPPVDEPAAMTPAQAVQAAVALDAGALLPIHFNEGFTHDVCYRPQTQALTGLRAGASAAELPLLLPEIGAWIAVPQRATAA